MREAQADYISKYGREWNREAPHGLKGRIDRLIDGPYKPRKFGVRSASEHLVQGTKNYAKLMMSPTNMGVHLAFSGIMASDNLLDPKEGFVRTLAESITGEAGFMAGAAVGPALAALAIPGSGLIAGAAMIAGGFGGALAASAIPGMIADYSEWGNKNGRNGRPFRSGFVDSEKAATMRQRGVQAIYRSQLNARSALGSEALAYHG
jgi:hypothetical protein